MQDESSAESCLMDVGSSTCRLGGGRYLQSAESPDVAADSEIGTAHAQEREAGAAALLQDRVLAAAFAWFSAPTAYFGGWNAAEAW